jgi:hypothetical protein
MKMRSLKFLPLLLCPFFCAAQDSYKGLPVVKANTVQTKYQIGKDGTKLNWTITPQASPDVLPLVCFSGKEEVTFTTDVATKTLTVKPGENKQFYMLLNGKDYALTEVKGLTFPELKFEEKPGGVVQSFRYETDPEKESLKKLRTEYQLDKVVAGAKNDTEKALKMMNWVHQQWKHNGSNQPSKPDALTILQEARDGKQFRCVEYGIVTTACLNAVGLKSRVLGLKTKDVETTASGAGHVVLETYLNDLGKWVILDSQWDAMPVLKGKPLNAVEFQEALRNDFKKLEIQSLSGTNKQSYANWILPYLYYFDTKFDNREEVENREQVNGKKGVMLVPLGAKNPTVFQQQSPITYCIYTNSVADFYAKPQ